MPGQSLIYTCAPTSAPRQHRVDMQVWNRFPVANSHHTCHDAAPTGESAVVPATFVTICVSFNSTITAIVGIVHRVLHNNAFSCCLAVWRVTTPYLVPTTFLFAQSALHLHSAVEHDSPSFTHPHRLVEQPFLHAHDKMRAAIP